MSSLRPQYLEHLLPLVILRPTLIRDRPQRPLSRPFSRRQYVRQRQNPRHRWVGRLSGAPTLRRFKPTSRIRIYPSNHESAPRPAGWFDHPNTLIFHPILSLLHVSNVPKKKRLSINKSLTLGGQLDPNSGDIIDYGRFSVAYRTSSDSS